MTAGKVAVPYYGMIYRSKFGFEKIYFLVDAFGSGVKEQEIRIGVWDHKTDHTLPEWLKNNGVRSLICREDPERHLKEKMSCLGIDVFDETDEDASRLMETLMV